MIRIIAWLWLIFLAPSPVWGADFWNEVLLGGSLKSLNLYLEPPSGSGHEGWLVSERLRLDLTTRLLAAYSFEFSIEQQLLWSEPPELISLPEDSPNRVVALGKSWNRNQRTETQLQVDRLNLHGEVQNLQWTLGRQAIGFGRIGLFSPLDVIAPFPPDALDVDVRPGVDAIKVVHYFGLAGQIGGIAVFGDQSQHHSYLLTFTENLANIDVLVLTGSLRDRQLLGGGLAGEIGLLGVKAEASWYQGQRVGEPGGDLHERFVQGALESWYRFDNGLVLIMEYLYNGVGVGHPEDYPRVAASAPLTEGLSFLLGRHYLLVAPTYDIHPLVTASGLLICNLEDSSGLVRPQLAVSLADNLQLDLFWSFVWGRKSETDPLVGFPVVRSEFGSAGGGGGLLLRWYF